MPDNLPPELIAALQRNGITQLYSHQLSALLALRKGKDVIITTATASGKTLSAYPAILEGCLNKGYRAISFYSLKALALDQFNKISALLAGIPEASRPKVAMLTGDIKTEERERLLATNPHIIGATPELIHYQLRASWRSEHWSAFFKRLRYILVDESHLFSSVMGASMALLLRRIKLAVDHHGGTSAKLQFIFLSATVGNPVQLAQRLSGRTRDPNRLVLIDKSGAAASEKRLLVLKPSTNANPDAAKIILYLLKQGMSGITSKPKSFSPKSAH